MLKERNFNVEIRDGILGWDITKFHPKKKNDSSFLFCLLFSDWMLVKHPYLTFDLIRVLVDLI